MFPDNFRPQRWERGRAAGRGEGWTCRTGPGQHCQDGSTPHEVTPHFTGCVDGRAGPGHFQRLRGQVHADRTGAATRPAGRLRCQARGRAHRGAAGAALHPLRPGVRVAGGPFCQASGHQRRPRAADRHHGADGGGALDEVVFGLDGRVRAAFAANVHHGAGQARHPAGIRRGKAAVPARRLYGDAEHHGDPRGFVRGRAAVFALVGDRGRHLGRGSERGAATRRALGRGLGDVPGRAADQGSVGGAVPGEPVGASFRRCGRGVARAAALALHDGHLLFLRHRRLFHAAHSANRLRARGGRGAHRRRRQHDDADGRRGHDAGQLARRIALETRRGARPCPDRRGLPVGDALCDGLRAFRRPGVYLAAGDRGFLDRALPRAALCVHPAARG